MKSLICAVAAASLLAIPVASFAQTNAPVTRAQVRAELVQLEKQGYQPSRNDPYYPSDIQAAEARVAASKDTSYASGYGPDTSGSSNAGISSKPSFWHRLAQKRRAAARTRDTDGCVGPASFCNIYFGGS
jgi:hypothetical protein